MLYLHPIFECGTEAYLSEFTSIQHRCLIESWYTWFRDRFITSYDLPRLMDHSDALLVPDSLLSTGQVSNESFSQYRRKHIPLGGRTVCLFLSDLAGEYERAIRHSGTLSTGNDSEGKFPDLGKLGAAVTNQILHSTHRLTYSALNVTLINHLYNLSPLHAPSVYAPPMGVPPTLTLPFHEYPHSAPALHEPELLQLWVQTLRSLGIKCSVQPYHTNLLVFRSGTFDLSTGKTDYYETNQSLPTDG